MNQPPKKLSSSPIVITTPPLKTETGKQDFSKIDSNLNDDSFKENPARRPSSSVVEESQLPEPREYDRISIRILKETKAKLIDLKLETGIPYEILIEVLVSQWDELPKRTIDKIAKLGQIERNKRLAEGQHKSMRKAMERLQR